jgi:hypothetical protein
MKRLNQFGKSQDKLKRLDLRHARLSHLHWEMDLDRPFDSMVGVLSGLPTIEECELGLWLQDRGLVEFHDFFSIKQVEEQHALFHAIADSCHLAIQSNIPDEFERLRKQLSQVSREILYLLTLLELEYRQNYRTQNQHLSPIQELIQIFSSFDHNGLEQDLRLNVSDARLFHMLWIQEEMTASFKNYGHQVDLSHLEQCDLGVWIHDVGLTEYAQLEEVHQLNDTHQSFHEHARVVLGALRHRRFQSADNAYGKLQSLSRDIIYWLTRVEMRLDDKDMVGPV